MNWIKRLFSSDSPEPPRYEKPLYQSEWVKYDSEHHDEQAHIGVDVGCKEIAGLSRQPSLCIVTLLLSQTSLRESPLDSAEEALNRKLTAALGATYAGSIHLHTKKLLFFYLPADEPVEDHMSDVLSNTEGLSWEVKIVSDPDWKVFTHDLYPPADALLMHQNAKNYQFYKEQQEEGGLPWPEYGNIYHFIMFKDEDNLSKCRAELIKLGFEVSDESQENQSVMLEVKKEEKLSLDHINEVTLALQKLALTFHGTYEDWEVNEEEWDHED
ncbi:DUF695 domain-containing protein [Roseivirga sp. BDSF3-8]|uniref:DUF695 domain-containing protein n=1 Tax=Roseivirga sp. BDSF3-8 TaxID=3241598 RepID=UPI003532740F